MFTDHRLILLRQRRNEFMRVCELCRLYFPSRACIRAAQANILRNSSMKQIGMLGDPGDLFAPLRGWNLFERGSVRTYCPTISRNEALKQVSNGTLSRSTRSNERDLLS